MAEAWFDRQMRAPEEFDVPLTFCFAPQHRGVQLHPTSPAVDIAARNEALPT